MSLNLKTKKKHLWFLGVACSLLFIPHAWADECMNLDGNAKWNKQVANMNDQMAAKQWDDALKTAESLYTICERSPMLNYKMGQIYKEKGNDSKSLYYLQRATLYTEEFAVKGRALEQMWFARFEAEYPEASREAITARNQEIEALKAQVQQNRERSVEARFDESAERLTEKNHYGAGLWTGVAFAGAGLVLTGVGAYLVYDNSKPIEYIDDDSEYHVKGNYSTSWAILGTGIAAVVTGSIIAGIMGYYYTHTDVSTNPVSFSISPTSANLTVTF